MPAPDASPYVTREQAATLFDGTAEHIYQGDIFQSLELIVPRAGGMLEPIITHAMVISHDCEFTKIADNVNKPLLVAPLRELDTFSQKPQIIAGQAHALWALPAEPPLDDEYGVDFRLIQPIAVGQLKDAEHWTCLGAKAKLSMQARLARFLLRREVAQ